MDPSFNSRADSRVSEIEQKFARVQLAHVKSNIKTKTAPDSSEVSETSFEAIVASMMKNQMMSESMGVFSGSKDDNNNNAFGANSNMLNTGLIMLLQKQAAEKSGMYRDQNIDPQQLMSTGLMSSMPAHLAMALNSNQSFAHVHNATFPIDNGKVSSHFGNRIHPSHGHYHSHEGVDIAAPAGTPIKSPWSGEVVYVGHADGFGKNTVIVAHKDTKQPDGKILYSVFGHNEHVHVQKGQQLAKGEVLGTVGSDGVATGPHLHWETRWAEPGLYGKEVFKDHLSMAIDPLSFA